jgi:hypothetical protein
MFLTICAPAFGDIILPAGPWELIKDRPQTSRPVVDIPGDDAVSDDAVSNDVISGEAVSADAVSGDATSGDAASVDLRPGAAMKKYLRRLSSNLSHFFRSGFSVMCLSSEISPAI